MAKNLEISLLLDFYGEMLTEKQREVIEYYYNDDLSLAEIADNQGITRQGVRDVIVRAEAYMNDIEDHTGLLKRFLEMRPHVETIAKAADEIRTINFRQYDDNRLSKLSADIIAAAATLKE